MVEFIDSQQYRQILDSIEKEFIISKTNVKGIITYVNEEFCRVSGYKKEELIGKPHNIVRHPDMPKQVFKELWHTIKEEKKPWTGFIKNKKKDGTHYWVLSTILPIFSAEDPLQLDGFLSIRKEITDIMDHFEENTIFSKLYKILNYYNENPGKDLHAILSFALDELLKFEWLEVENKGGIMLYNEETEELEMFVHKGVGESLLTMCNRVSMNRCLCGKAAALKEIIFKSHVDEDHENRPQGILPHGHYNVPLMINNQLLGVLFLYVVDGYKKRDIELKFFNVLSMVLSSIIYRYKLEQNLLSINLKNFLFLQHLKRFSSRDTFHFSKNEIFSNGNSQKEENHSFFKERYLNLMFLDIVNYTGFSENKKPVEVKEIINHLFSEIIDIIYRNQGDIDKFIGDAIFSYFEDANQALISAIKIIKLLNDKQKNPYNIKMRIGIHSGNVIHTQIGNDLRSDFTLIGDVVNTAQRIERASRANQILVSKDFFEQIDKRILDQNKLKISRMYYLKGKNKKNLVPVYFIAFSELFSVV